MANNTTSDAKKQKLITLLYELFQLDKPELDFGLYKIMHAKSKQISEFLQNDLLKEIQQAFGEKDEVDTQTLKNQAQAKLKEALGDEALDEQGQLSEIYANTPAGKRYLDEMATAEAAKETLTAEAEIYDHLYRFFERYYDNGDFMSRRYYARESDSRAAPFSVPYDGREVYLHWANKDQYYIKSSEYLTNYSFELNEAIRQQAQVQKQSKDDEVPLDFGEAITSQSQKVHLRIVSASEGEQGNIKAGNDQKRFFIIHDEPVIFENGELVIQFQYRADPSKTGQDKKWQDSRLDEAETAIIEALNTHDEGKAFLKALQLKAPTDSQKNRTLLGKHLQKYSARNTMDYFIHKDLGGFLRRELDFYIKNEIMRLDDLENAEVPKVEQYLSKIGVLRRIAHQLIAFLAQLEDFQKKLWLKKKFVTETNYCITLDRIPESLYPEIAANKKQREEWVNLFAINEIEGDLTTPGYSEPLTVEFLKANPFLLIDTVLFENGFKERLLAKFDDVDASTVGTIFNSDNFQALKFIKTKFSNGIDSVYLDPPYNTDASAILYKNDYKDSSWLSMINERLLEVSELMKLNAVVCMAIDDEESTVLKQVLSTCFEKEIGTAVVRSNPQSRKTKGALSPSHEYAYFFGKTNQATPGTLELSDKRLARYPFTDELGRFAWMNFIRTGSNDLRTDRPKLFYPIYVSVENVIRIPDMVWAKHEEKYIVKEEPNDGEEVVYPIRDTSDGSLLEKNWHRGFIRILENPSEYRVRRDADGKINIDFKTRIDEVALPSTWWDESEYASANYGASELKNLFDNKPFDFPKAKRLVKDCLKVAGADKQKATILDFFAGSATTGHAILDMERDDYKGRNYILVEMGSHFETVVKPRLKKVVFSSDWRMGKPKKNKDGRYDGLSHSFKYLRLESYEDALNNLTLKQDQKRDAVLSKNSGLHRDYLLNYFLDVETENSQSLLNIADFRDPTAYKMWIKKPGSDDQTLQTIDLIETFNWLLGLWVVHLAAPQTFSADFSREKDKDLPEDNQSRLVCNRLKTDSQGDYWFHLVEGYTLKIPGDDSSKVSTLIIWRKLTDDPEKDNAALQKYLETIGISTREKTYDVIYVNGSHTLPNPVVEGEQTKVRLIEEAFHQAMWSEA